MILNNPDLVNFDPTNIAHRDAVKGFMKNRTWGNTNLRFTVDQEYSSVAIQVQVRLLEWYIAQEDSKKRTSKV